MKTFLITSLILTSVGFAAAEGRPGGDPEKREAMKAKMLEKFDANKDGELDETERKAAREARKGMKGKKGGKKSPEMRAKLLEKFDANKDGKLDETERAAAKAAREAKKSEAAE